MPRVEMDAATHSGTIFQGPWIQDGVPAPGAFHVSTDGWAKAAAGKQAPVDSDTALSHFVARVMQQPVERSLACGGQARVPRQTSVLGCLARNHQLINLEHYKELSAEGGELNRLYRALESESRLQPLALKPVDLLEKAFRNAKVKEWATGGEGAIRVISTTGEYTRMSLAQDLDQWGQAVQVRVQPTLAWLAPEDGPGQFGDLLKGLHEVSTGPFAWSARLAGATLLGKCVRGICVRDWGCEQGPAQTWFSQASAAEKARVAEALGGWMADAARLIGEPRASVAVVRV